MLGVPWGPMSCLCGIVRRPTGPYGCWSERMLWEAGLNLLESLILFQASLPQSIHGVHQSIRRVRRRIRSFPTSTSSAFDRSHKFGRHESLTESTTKTPDRRPDSAQSSLSRPCFPPQPRRVSARPGRWIRHSIPGIATNLIGLELSWVLELDAKAPESLRIQRRSAVQTDPSPPYSARRRSGKLDNERRPFR